MGRDNNEHSVLPRNAHRVLEFGNLNTDVCYRCIRSSEGCYITFWEPAGLDKGFGDGICRIAKRDLTLWRRIVGDDQGVR